MFFFNPNINLIYLTLFFYNKQFKTNYNEFCSILVLNFFYKQIKKQFATF